MTRRLSNISRSVVLLVDVDFQGETYTASLTSTNNPEAGHTARSWTARGVLPGPWSFGDLSQVKKALARELPHLEVGLWNYNHLKGWLRSTAQGEARYFLANPNVGSHSPGTGEELSGEGTAYGLKALPLDRSIGTVGVSNALEIGIWDIEWLRENNLTVAKYVKGQTPNKVKA